MDILSIIFAPVVAFLKQQGLWTNITTLYQKISQIFDGISGIVGIQTHAASSTSFVGSAGGFITILVQISITVFHVLINIANWVLALFK